MQNRVERYIALIDRARQTRQTHLGSLRTTIDWLQLQMVQSFEIATDLCSYLNSHYLAGIPPAGVTLSQQPDGTLGVSWQSGGGAGEGLPPVRFYRPYKKHPLYAITGARLKKLRAIIGVHRKLTAALSSLLAPARSLHELLHPSEQFANEQVAVVVNDLITWHVITDAALDEMVFAMNKLGKGRTTRVIARWEARPGRSIKYSGAKGPYFFTATTRQNHRPFTRVPSKKKEGQNVCPVDSNLLERCFLGHQRDRYLAAAQNIWALAQKKTVATRLVKDLSKPIQPYLKWRQSNV